jgi:hypothetical protein
MALRCKAEIDCRTLSPETSMLTPDETAKSLPNGARPRPTRRPRRYEPTGVYALAEQLKREGVDLHRFPGPWRPVRRPLRRPGRNAERALAVITNGVVDIAVDTAEHAVDLAGLLNSAGVDHLNPVPNLRPPAQDLACD